MGVSRGAHALRGSLVNFGAHAAVAAADRLEKMGRAAELADVDRAFAELVAQIDRVNAALASIVS